eukprot:Polyplicarium_translucidae@DN2429_c0_g1_i2.p2
MECVRALQELNTDLDEENESLTQQIHELTHRYQVWDICMHFGTSACTSQTAQSERDFAQAEADDHRRRLESLRRRGSKQEPPTGVCASLERCPPSNSFSSIEFRSASSFEGRERAAEQRTFRAGTPQVCTRCIIAVAPHTVYHTAPLAVTQKTVGGAVTSAIDDIASPAVGGVDLVTARAIRRFGT